MSRLPEINRGMIPEKLRSAFDELIADSGGNVPIGPGSVAAISPEMALRLARLFGNSPEFWLNAQRSVDLWTAAQSVKEEVDRIKPLHAA